MYSDILSSIFSGNLPGICCEVFSAMFLNVSDIHDIRIFCRSHWPLLWNSTFICCDILCTSFSGIWLAIHLPIFLTCPRHSFWQFEIFPAYLPTFPAFYLAYLPAYFLTFSLALFLSVDQAFWQSFLHTF